MEEALMFELYGCDTETTGIHPDIHEPIEVSFYRLSTDECRTWCLKPINIDKIEKEALKKNGHRYEDITHRTPEGRERYRKPEEVLVEIENWLMEDGMATDQRVLLGHNVRFDINMLVALWAKCGAKETYPTNQKYGIDTMGLEFSFDYAKGIFGEGYSLRNLTKKYGVKNDKAHTSEADTRATVAVYREQLKFLKGLANQPNA
jgi:DNA polymerase III epsilon subunit-like protein